MINNTYRNDNIILTDEQERIIQMIYDWYYHSPDRIFQLSGPAGTGKSLVLHKAIEYLGFNERDIAPMAYTGSASIIMRLNGFENAKTIHSTIYKYVYSKNKGEKKFIYIGLEPHIKLIVLDEASMVDKDKLKDLLRTGVKILAAGDIDQLPPVKSYNSAFFTNPNEVVYLTQIMRQKINSAIVQIANMVKSGLSPKPGIYNNGEVVVITKDDFNQNFESIRKNFQIILCGKNTTRDGINKKIREEIMHYPSPFPVRGEPLICRRNNWNLDIDGINLVNGLYGYAAKTVSISDFNPGGYFSLDFRPNYLNKIFYDCKADYDYFTSDYKRRSTLRNIPFFLDHEFFEYAYSCTVHSAQGSQYDNGVFIEEYIPGVPTNKLNYTGITRFRNNCLYVKK